MNASFYDLLKYANTGIASPGMTYYDKMRALAMTGGGTIKTLTGIPPLSFTGNGKPLISLSMLGNAQQTGTPSPDNIIMPTFCGVRTGNLADTEKGGLSASDGSEVAYNATQSQIRSQYIPCDALTNYIVGSTNYSCNNFVAFYAADKSFISRTSGTPISQPRIISTPENAAFMRVAMYHSLDEQIYPFDAGAKIMLNLGSTALPYEPYGWAEKITCAGQTVPVYLGQTPTVRRIKKRVFTGQESWPINDATGAFYTFAINDFFAANGITCMCSHYPAQNNASGVGEVQNKHVCFRTSTYSQLYLKDTDFNTTDALKSYLAAQYAAGTPVTVWYVLAEPETAIVNEPLAKIGDYADELHSTDAAVTIPTANGDNTLTVDTDLQPSSMTITGHIE